MGAESIVLDGCSTEPLSDYLKALGVFRLVAEQADPEARGYWKNGVFVLQTKLRKEELVKFFLTKYAPTPIISPWNGASGFYFHEGKSKEKDSKGHRIKTGNRNVPTAATLALDNLWQSKAERLARYRECIGIAKSVVEKKHFISAPKENEKRSLVSELRARLPDYGIRWLDASIVLTSSKLDWPPILGTGGNDGNADFSSNFIQRIFDILDLNTGDPQERSRGWLENALFGLEANNFLRDKLSGQFSPSSTGGSNAEVGFESESIINPWGWLLLIEGALLFAAASAKRLTSVRPGVSAAPFAIRASASGYGTAAGGEKIRSEMWLPTWETPARITEIETLFSEGRAEFGGRSARNALEFAQSVTALGIDRGLTAFHRYAFMERNGQSYFAVKLDTFDAQGERNADLLREPIEWLGRSRRSKDPEVKTTALREIEENLLRLCHRGFEKPEPAMETIAAFGKLMQEASRRKDNWEMKPHKILDAVWLEKANDGSAEFRLAASLASLLHSEFDAYFSDNEKDKSKKDVGKWLRFAGEPVRLLNVIMADRILRLKQKGRDVFYSDEASVYAQLADVNAFMAGRLDDKKIIDLMFGLMFLKKWDGHVCKDLEFQTKSEEACFPGAAYALAKLCHTGLELDGKKIGLVPAIHKRMASGDGKKALELAVRRLRASGCQMPKYKGLAGYGAQYERIAAALLFPLNYSDIMLLKRRISEREKG